MFFFVILMSNITQMFSEAIIQLMGRLSYVKNSTFRAAYAVNEARIVACKSLANRESTSGCGYLSVLYDVFASSAV